MSSPSGVRGGAPAKNEFDAIYALQNASGGRIISIITLFGAMLLKLNEMLVSHGGSSSARSFVTLGQNVYVFDLALSGVAPQLQWAQCLLFSYC